MSGALRRESQTNTPENGSAGRARHAWLARSVLPALLLTLTLWLFASIAAGVGREGYFGADDLYVPTLVEDLLYWAGTIRAWRLTPAPYFVPDMLLYAPVRIVSGSVEAGQYFAGLAQLLLYALASAHLVRSLVPTSQRLATASLSLLLLGLCALSMTRTSDLALYGKLYHITNHGGAALLTVITLSMCISESKRPLGRLAAIALLALVGGLSDPLYAVSCGSALLPIAVCIGLKPLANVLRVRLDGAKNTQAYLRMLVGGVAAFGGASLTKLVHTRLNPLPKEVITPSKLIAVDAMFHDFTHGSSIRGWWILASFATSAAVLGCVRDNRTRLLRVVALWHITSLLATLAAMVWTQLYLDAGTQRYLVVPLTFTPLVAASGIALLFRRYSTTSSQGRAADVLAALGVATLLGSSLALLPTLARGQYRSDWRDEARCVERVMVREDVDVLLADYWKAKPLMLFSGGKVHAVQMRAKLKRPYFWISSRAWLRGKLHFGVVAVNDLNPAAIRARFGEPASIEQCAGTTLYSYRGAQRARLAKKMSQSFGRYLRARHPL